MGQARRPRRLAVFLAGPLVLAAAGQILPPRGASHIPTLRLRVELKTTSRLAVFGFETADLILTSRVLSAEGPLASISWTLRQVSTLSVEPGTPIALDADYILFPNAAGNPLPFFVDHSPDGRIEVTISMLDAAGDPHLVRSIDYAGGGRVEDALALDSDPALLRPGSRSADPRPPNLVLALYYPWYESADWSSPYLQDCPLDPYSSSDPAAVARQIETAAAAGIDGFIASWWGPHDAFIDRNFRILLSVARTRGFRVAPYFETMDGDRPRDESSLLRWLRDLLERFGNDPALLRIGGRPVVFFWVSYAVPLSTWERVFRQVRSEGLEFSAIGAYGSPEPSLEALDVFDGLHTYNILGIIEAPGQAFGLLPRAYGETGRAVRFYPLLDGSGAGRLWTATVTPGFDDHLLPGRDSPVFPRSDGALYRASWEAAVSSRPDWIIVSTWNEWWENTEIEPGWLHGDLYLRLTRELADAWKKGAAAKRP
jgi:hypothetical protein